MSLTCPECGSPMALRTGQWGPFYGCTNWPDCDGMHSAHADGRPMGSPADRRTRAARKEAHEAFDRLWKSNRMMRSDAYRWMARTMGLPDSEAHIGMFNLEQCQRLVAAVNERLADGQQGPTADDLANTFIPFGRFRGLTFGRLERRQLRQLQRDARGPLRSRLNQYLELLEIA